jgi:hypothetical protein
LFFPKYAGWTSGNEAAVAVDACGVPCGNENWRPRPGFGGPDRGGFQNLSGFLGASASAVFAPGDGPAQGDGSDQGVKVGIDGVDG